VEVRFSCSRSFNLSEVLRSDVVRPRPRRASPSSGSCRIPSHDRGSPLPPRPTTPTGPP